MLDLPKNSADFARLTHVSRETLSDYTVWADLLTHWNKRINLVAPGSDAEFWTRHAYDSWQVTEYLPEGWKCCVDFGSGAGFPGLAVAIAAKVAGQGEVHLVESAGKKASFLRTVIRELKLPAKVHAGRIESIEPLSADVLTARAFAPLPKLLAMAERHTDSSTRFVLLKGAQATTEIDAAAQTHDFDYKSAPSLTHNEGQVLILNSVLARKTMKASRA